MSVKYNYIPLYPDKWYKDKGWISFNNFFGIKHQRVKKNNVLSFEDAKKFVKKLKLKTSRQWREYVNLRKSPDNIPNDPDMFYKRRGKWKGWADFLGTKNVALRYRVYLSFKEARKFARSLKLSGQKEWEGYSKSGMKPDKVPSCPRTVYKTKGWKGWGDFLGTGNISIRNKDFISFEEARKFIHSLRFKNVKEWREYCRLRKRPNNIPSNPQLTYKDSGWVNWIDWLGIE